MKRRTRFGIWLAMALTGGTMFQTIGFTRNGLGSGCGGFNPASNLLVNGALSGVDFCYLLDCNNGFFGGAFQPCDASNPLLTDCSPTIPVDVTTTTGQTQTQQQTAQNNLGF